MLQVSEPVPDDPHPEEESAQPEGRREGHPGEQGAMPVRERLGPTVHRLRADCRRWFNHS
jgi:hypothetical protein